LWPQKKKKRAAPQKKEEKERDVKRDEREGLSLPRAKLPRNNKPGINGICKKHKKGSIKLRGRM